MIRILHVFGRLNLGGAESRIMDIYRNIDRDKVQFDFVVHSQERDFFEDEIESLGGRIFRVPRYNVYNQSAYKNAWEDLLREHAGEFKMIHGHMTSTAGIYLPIAKEMGIETTIAHVRSAGVDPGLKGIMTRILRSNLSSKADYLFACSKLAAISAYGKKAYEQGLTTFIPNAIDTSKFRFDPEMRKEIRQELNIDDRYVIGHVGRFHYAKNHEYLIRVFAEVIKKQAVENRSNRPLLLLIGDGPRKQEMMELSSKLDIGNDVIFAGNKSDVYKYYNAMDSFVYPSRYEGLPGTVIEAQASGLRCIISDSICSEVFVSDIIMGMSILAPEYLWADKVMDIDKKSLVDRAKYADIVAKAGFDVKEQTAKMTAFYLGDKTVFDE